MNKNYFCGLLIILAIVLQDCKSKAKICQDCLDKAVKLGCLDMDSSKRIMTKIIKGDSIHDSIPVYISVKVLDSLRQKYRDTCYNETVARTIIRNAKVKPVDTMYNSGRLRIWMVDGVFRFDFKEKDRIDTTAIIDKKTTIKPISTTKGEFNWWRLAFLVLLIGGMVIWILRLIKGKG